MCNLSKDIHGVDHWTPRFQILDSYNWRVTNVLLIAPPQESIYLPRHPSFNQKQRKSHSGSGEYGLWINGRYRFRSSYFQLVSGPLFLSHPSCFFHVNSSLFNRNRSPSLRSQMCICLFHLSGFSSPDHCVLSWPPFYQTSF